MEGINPYKIATFDIESTDWINAFMLGFFDGQIYKEFEGEDCIDKFMDYVLRNDYRHYKIYAHFGCRFDFLFICDYLDRHKILDKTRMVIANGDILKMDLLDEGYNKPILSFYDSGRLLLKGLKDLTKSFDVKHKKLDVDRENMQNLSTEEVKEYLKYDTLGLYEVLEKFYDNIKSLIGIEPKLTIASTSMYGFKDYLNKNKVYFNVIKDYDLDNYLRKSFYGGRVEIFKMYGKDIYAYDINSMYPYVMRNGTMPFGKYIKLKAGRDYSHMLDKYIGYGTFKVKAPKLDIPLLPYRKEKLVFPIGEFIGHFSTTEVEKAKQLGYEMEFMGGYFCRKKDGFFKDYIDLLFAEKIRAIENGDTTKELIIKIVMNSLFGKFGENWYKSKILYNLQEVDYGNNEIEVIMENPPIYLHHQIIRKQYYNVGIASEITTLSRIRLYEVIEKIVALGYEIYYVDTDCIHTNCPPYKMPKELMSKTELGMLKQEYLKYGGTIKEALYLAPKFYFLKMKNGEVIKKHKGFREIDLSFEEIVGMFLNRKVKIQGKSNSIMKFQETINVKNLITEKRTITEKGLFLKKKELVKTFNSLYDKRIVKGIRTLPLCFFDIIEDMEGEED